MKYSSNEICKAAKAIQPYIAELLDAPSAQRLERQLQGLLSQSSLKQGSHTELSRLLMAHQATQDWVRLYLEEQYPVEKILKALRIYYPLSGLKNPVESPRYICPVEQCHQDWYRYEREEAIPKCPIHGLQLVIDS